MIALIGQVGGVVGQCLGGGGHRGTTHLVGPGSETAPVTGIGAECLGRDGSGEPVGGRGAHTVVGVDRHYWGGVGAYQILAHGKVRYRESEAPTPIDETSGTAGSGASCVRAVAVRWC